MNAKMIIDCVIYKIIEYLDSYNQIANYFAAILQVE